MSDNDAPALNGNPGQREYIWGEKDIVAAKRTLRIKYPDAASSVEVIQEMIDELSAKYRYDPVQIERVILQHFRKK